jgi:hypothetical protein
MNEQSNAEFAAALLGFNAGLSPSMQRRCLPGTNVGSNDTKLELNASLQIGICRP